MALATEQKPIVYPSGDGEPVAESYAHMYVMFVTLEVLRQYLAGQQATVLANQFLYYAQGFPKLRVAPDVMVIFQVPPGGRDSYKIWEEGQVPQVIFEMTSAQTQRQDQEYKKDLYQALGVQEYWLFDPKGEWLKQQLVGYRLVEENYVLIPDNIAKHTKVDMIWVAGRSPTLVSQNLKATTLTYLAISVRCWGCVWNR